jgi:very-short-patch-repair endonuclease
MLRRMRLPVTPSDLSRQTLRSLHERGDLHRPWRGVYTPSLDELDRIQALFRLLPPEARLADMTAARWYGFAMDDSPRICVVVPQGATHNRLAGVTVRESFLPLPQPVLANEIPLLPPERVAIDLARMSPRMNALPLLDMALRSGACTAEDLATEVLAHKGLRGVIQARELVPMADPRPESVQESRLRLIVIDAGLPWPTPQLVVGFFRLDLGYEAFRVGLEYDGASHITRDRLRADRHRMNYLANLGWQMRYFTDADIYQHRNRIVTTIRPLLR